MTQLEIVCASKNPKWVRYFIVNESGLFWDGSGWNTNRSSALLFVKGHEVSEVYNQLMEAPFKAKPLREFQVTLNVQVWADQKYKLQDVQRYLAAATGIVLDLNQCGPGPVSESFTKLHIGWDELIEVPSRTPEP